MADFLNTFSNREVDVYCGGRDWFYGTVEAIIDGVVTLLAPEGVVHINTERILSVAPRKAKT